MWSDPNLDTDIMISVSIWSHLLISKGWKLAPLRSCSDVTDIFVFLIIFWICSLQTVQLSYFASKISLQNVFSFSARILWMTIAIASEMRWDDWGDKVFNVDKTQNCGNSAHWGNGQSTLRNSVHGAKIMSGIQTVVTARAELIIVFISHIVDSRWDP
jgi:hypothetical protein